MKMRMLMVFAFAVMVFAAVAQSRSRGETEHKVMPKENWYSIGRLYEMSPREIAAHNGLTLEVVLKIGQRIKIPGREQQPKPAPEPAPEAKKNEYVAPKKDIPEPRNEPPTPRNELPTPRKELTETRKDAGLIQQPTASPSVSVLKVQGAGFFAGAFDQQLKEGKQQRLDQPLYGIFKSSSGWEDGKFYLLLNGVVPGTIVKLRSLSSGKVVYAKVLGAVPLGKENEGLNLRLSSATAAALGITEQSKGGIDLIWYN